MLGTIGIALSAMAVIVFRVLAVIAFLAAISRFTDYRRNHHIPSHRDICLIELAISFMALMFSVAFDQRF